MPKPVDKIFPQAAEDKKNGKCPFCKKAITDFRDALSKREYKISGLCQECQDEVFSG